MDQNAFISQYTHDIKEVLINLKLIAKFVLKHDFDSNLKHKCLFVH